ncbi:alpha/beta hydrolase [Halorubrum ezzemoulense]|uniref:alpha/beta fold hydrolase n=1 Tax=Halorubrum ezzemoulense TaxID=337243 RepID=UPI00232F8E71|nr:alpha/beta hydrolase [Halorubrum ezzemoulense]MDB9250721.1 alpha/beta hydrolase [Halorubrum ezzemoulense]MDB9253825.1 alpha/beta hydrolase [Halorubrum ezzemoulense]MDB9257371.1 alpha/beta hydrolase [Halorubrum ezzemoulense]MDB9260836.1 alpha/beta hydrolase [Halorubrum ezzemoulense]MDB9264264.1 alpha/beta hydrolase [Halorubrum ezzemoulense]
MYAKVNDAELYYELLGDPEDPTIISLHGGPGISDHSKGKQAFEPLTDQYSLLVYDHRGCGDSSLTPPYSNEQYAKDADALRETLELGDVVLIGGSYGGFITQEYASRFPEHLNGFVLRDTAPTSEYEENAWENARSKWPQLREMDLGVPKITWDEFSRVMEGDVNSDEEFERVFHGMAPLYAPSLEAFDEAAAEAAAEATESRNFHHETHNVMFTEAYPNMDYRDALTEIREPALVTVGRHDWITPPSASKEIADRLPDAELVIFERSGHSPNLDQQEQYLHRVREFLASIEHGGDE